MSLVSQLQSLITAVGADVKDIRSKLVLVAPFYQGGVLSVTTGKAKFIVPPGNWTITAVSGIINTANTGASVLVDVNKNGTTIFTTQANRLTIPVSTTSVQASGTINVSSVSGGDILSVDVDQVGSTIAGADLSVQITLTRA